VNRRHIQLVLRQAASVGRLTKTDAELLRRFAAERDEAAFAELVRRHGRLVWALCRNLLPSEADADDAFQATFLALARSPGSVRDGGRVGPWLHGVAYRVCLKARRAATRRKRREQAAAASEAHRPVADSAWDVALAAVHEEVCRLPESQRVPFVLCCLEGTSVTEAANLLGWKLGTLSSRLTRAKQTLIDRLAGRGLPAAVTAAVAATGGVSCADVPASLVTRTADLAFTAGPVSPTILSLAHGVTDMTLYRTKLLAAAVLLVGGLTAGVGSGWLAAAAAQQTNTPGASNTAAPPADRQPEQVQAADELFLLASQYALLNEKKPASRWEYDFVLASEMGTTKFVQFLRDREARGWEFNGEATLRHEGKDAPHWVFRRPVGQGAKSPPQVNDVLTLQYAQDLQPFFDEVLRNQFVQPNAEANRAKLLEAQIQSLQAELAKIRAQTRKQVTLGPTEVGIDPQEMMTFLGKLAARRFGPGYRERLELSSTSKGLDIRGDAEAVEWAVGVVRKLNEK
jgi:RNA polymerase sigma factor (sigma-70 family)